MGPLLLDESTQIHIKLEFETGFACGMLCPLKLYSEGAVECPAYEELCGVDPPSYENRFNLMFGLLLGFLPTGS